MLVRELGMIVYQFISEFQEEIRITPLKWFAGGSERRCEVMTIIDNLLEGINNTSQLTPLKNLLVSYKRRLEDDGTSNRLLY